MLTERTLMGHSSSKDQQLEELEETVPDKKMTPDEKTSIKLNIGKIPEILLDNTDRNRTSPFAFTGDRFEYRAVGSSANCASALIVLNTIVAGQLKRFKIEVDALVNKGVKKDEAILQTLKRYIKETKNIRFDGNGYSPDWLREVFGKTADFNKMAGDRLEPIVDNEMWPLPKYRELLFAR